MHAHVIFNNRLIEATKARLSPLASATLYGQGVFTTLAIYRSRPFLWMQHWMRLMDHAARSGIDCRSLDETLARASLLKLIEANEVKDGRARITLFGGADRGVWKFQGMGRPRTEMLMMTGDSRHLQTEEGLAL